MNLKEILYIRLNILEEGEVINKKVTNYTKGVIDIMLQEQPDITEDKAEMFFTHTTLGTYALEQANYLINKGINPQKIIIVHSKHTRECVIKRPT